MAESSAGSGYQVTAATDGVGAGGLKEWKCAKCSLALPGIIAGMKFCPGCKEDIPQQAQQAKQSKTLSRPSELETSQAQSSGTADEANDPETEASGGRSLQPASVAPSGDTGPGYAGPIQETAREDRQDVGNDDPTSATSPTQLQENVGEKPKATRNNEQKQQPPPNQPASTDVGQLDQSGAGGANAGTDCKTGTVDINPGAKEMGSGGRDTHFKGRDENVAQHEEERAYRKPKDAPKLYSGQRENVPSNANNSTFKYDYRNHQRPCHEELEGLNGRHSVAVTFHCFLPRHIWQWDGESQMYMRFEGRELGNWKMNVGEFKQQRKVEENVYEMVCSLNINKSLVTNPRDYKYVVYSPKMECDDDCFEFLHTFAGRFYDRNPNRCLRIEDSAADWGEYHKYDFFVYPETIKAEKGVFQRFADLFRSSTENATPKFVFSNTEEMVTWCLRKQLEPYRRVFAKDDQCPESFQLDTCLRRIKVIFEQHSRPCVFHPPNNYIRVAVSIIDEFRAWLEEVIVINKDVIDSNHQFISAVCVTCCLYSCHVTSISAELVKALIKMLDIQPNSENQTVPRVDLLIDVTSKPNRKTMSCAILELCQMAMESKDVSMEWLFVLPLYNFISDASKPFTSLEFKPKMFNGRMKKLGYSKFKNSKHLKEMFKTLEPYFEADALLFHDVICLTPEDDFGIIFRRIPSHLSILKLSACKPLPSKLMHAEKWVQWMVVIKEKVNEENIEKAACRPVVNAAEDLLRDLMSALGVEDHHLQVLMVAITLLLFSLQMIFNCDEPDVTMLTNTMGRCELYLKEWVKRSRGVCFGTKGQGNTRNLLYGSVELNMWQKILRVELPPQRMVAEKWKQSVENVIRQRVDKVSNKNKIGLIDMLEEGDGNIHPILCTIFMDAANEAIDNLSNGYEALDDLSESKRVGELYGHILVNKYPTLSTTESFSISLHDILSWTYWADFIKIYSGSSKTGEGLPENCKLACSCAISKLEEVSQQIKKGDITLLELQMIQKSLEQMKKLCDARIDVRSTESFATLHEDIKQRLDELSTLQTEQLHIKHLCKKVPPEVNGILEAKREVQIDYKSQTISSLCIRCKSGAIEIVCFDRAAPLLSFASKFYILTGTDNASAVFNSAWEGALKQALQKNQNLGVQNLESDVWTPAFELCRRLLQELCDLTISLCNVDLYFHTFEENELLSQVTILNGGICLCTCQNQTFDWIKISVNKISSYKKLCQYRTTAKYFLKLRDLLQLSGGDFSNVEKISNSTVLSSMEGQTLADITDELVQAGRFLSEFTGDKLECIQSFCECQSIVEWIRETTEDVNDLQNFVNVALVTAAGGEGALNSDRLSHLRTVGSGFNSLIYKLDPRIGFIKLCEKFTSVWDVYENNKYLPQMMESCNDDLEWYKSVKETQASVEVTSFGQMNNILSYGHYTIGDKRDMAMERVHDVIHLSLKLPTQIKVPNMDYDLDELKDLESKLVLITGSKAENRADVDHFLDTLHCVRRIADVLIKLQQAGNVQYIGRRINFNCKQVPVKDLQAQAREMEEELEKWNKDVELARKHFYELNYYTTRQLLVLRRELGKLKLHRQSSRPQWGKVMTLIGSISNDVQTTDLVKVVQEVTLEHLIEDETSPPSLPHTPIQKPNTPEHIEYTQQSVSQADESPSSVQHISTDGTCLPPVQLTVNELSGSQKEFFDDICDSYGYCSKTALMAIDAVKEGDWNDILIWLERNGDKWDGSFRDAGYAEDLENFSEDDESMETSSETDSEDDSSVCSTQSELDVSGGSALQLPFQPWYKKIVLAVDETHEEVQKLLEAGMGTVEECIQDIEMFETAQQAILIKMKADQEIDHSAVPLPVTSSPDQERAYSMEMKEMIILANDQYLRLDELGMVLYKLSVNFCPTISQRRNFTRFEPGQPHLLVVPPDQVLRAALYLYMEDPTQPLPTPEEMLVCNNNTTAEEVNLLWQRAVNDPQFRRIFCLVHAEKLSYQTADQTLRRLSNIIQNRQSYSLVIVCSNYKEEKCPIISKLYLYRRPYFVPLDLPVFKQYLLAHFVDENQPSYQQARHMESVPVSASLVDPSGSCVRVVFSKRTGMGKSLFITNMAKKLQAIVPGGPSPLISIPIHGPLVSADSILDCPSISDNPSIGCILHFDIAPSVLWQVDTVLFSLLILGGLHDSQGRVWRKHPSQLYAIEVTLPETSKDPSVAECITLQVLEMLPTVNCVKPKEVHSLMSRDVTDYGDKVVMDQKEFESQTFQRVYQYLRRHIAGHDLDRFSYSDSVEGTPKDCLGIFLRYCGIKDPSWAEIKYFVEFLNLQLLSSEKSCFTNEDFIADIMSGFKSFIVKFMIQMSRDFATSSLRGEVARENDEDDLRQDTFEKYQIVERKQWEHSSHPYLFFNRDGISVTFVGFMVSSNGDLLDPSHGRSILERGIMTQQLYAGLKAQRVNFNEDYHQWRKDVMIQKISTVMGIEWPYDPDPTYVLTVDNLIKILAIQMRFRCGIPVVIMGETGCGKTRLIRFMCDLASQGSGLRNMLILKVHGGTTERDVVDFVRKAEETAKENRSKNLDTVVFFDEANTTDAIGLIKEIMCDRRVHGNSISLDLKFIAACNPYRRHTDDMIRKLRSAGLGFYVKETETQQKLGKIPLRELVYRVIDLPPSMRPLVYDFGQLNTDTEKDYTHQIVHDHIRKHPVLSNENIMIIPAIAHVLAWSQKYMRERKDECSFVSLRDVERAMIVFTYFFEKIHHFTDRIDHHKSSEEITQVSHQAALLQQAPVVQLSKAVDITQSLILAISVCYHARLSDRNDYEKQISTKFIPPLTLPGGTTEFRNTIERCQKVLLESMVLGENIARNAALRENVFMMAVCVDLRIPLFLVGKPGSSKSLAKAIVAHSMRGQASQNELLKSFKQVHMFSYQCSQLSTPQSVIEVFNTAKRFQRDQDTSKYVSVVVLDEVGLAEDSPNLPLKALHPLLEDGTEGSGDDDEIVAREKRVAFIGISNWALDPAKMNRGVMVTRGDPDVKELVVSAEGICHSEDNDIKERLRRNFRDLAEAYHEICERQTRQFFGLRDFYSLIKMLYWMCKESGSVPTGPQLVHAIKRNFGGLEDDKLDPEGIFFKLLPELNLSNSLTLESPNNTQPGLIRTSLMTRDTSWHGENRYLLFLTENYAALEILKQYLHDQEGGHPLLSIDQSAQTLNVDQLIALEASPFTEADKEELLSSSEERIAELISKFAPADADEGDAEGTQAGADDTGAEPTSTEPSPATPAAAAAHQTSLKPLEMEPFVLFGSSFPKDKEYTQVCRNINQIKICMEIGRTVILLNLENLYESLYDVLNQYYIHHGGNRYVDLGLQTHKVKCRVHDKFKLILIAEKTTVYEEFPTPLINRLEKHFVLYSSVLEDWQNDTLKHIKRWIYEFSTMGSSNTRFKESDAFVGYQKDVAAAVVFQTSNQLRKTCGRLRGEIEGRHQLWETAWDKELLGNYGLNELAVEEEGSDVWREAALLIGQFLLLQTTPPAALVRLGNSKLRDDEKQRLKYLYQEQHHGSIGDFLTYHLSVHDNSRGGLLLQVTTHSHILSSDEVEVLSDLYNNLNIHYFVLQGFDTELDFTNKVSPLFLRDESSETPSLIIIQCDSGHLNGDLIACARYRIYDMRAKALLNRTQYRHTTTHVVFIIHLPVKIANSTFVGFQGDPWVSCHIDELRPSDKYAITLDGAQGVSISQLFYGGLEPVLDRQTSDRSSNMESGSGPDRQLSQVSSTAGDEWRNEEEVVGDIMDQGMTEGREGGNKLELSSQSEGGGDDSDKSDNSQLDSELTMDTSEISNQPPAPVSTYRHLQPVTESVCDMYTQCVRLNSCIQAAASRLQDSTENKQRAADRVKLLIKLIPPKPRIPLEPGSFYCIMVVHIHRMLCEREHIIPGDWVLNEAMDMHHLQTGGTFMNVLTRKLDDIIIPCLAEIIAFVDRRRNLEHLKNVEQPLSQFWLKIFASQRVRESLRFSDMIIKQKVQMIDDNCFCQFPFSWLVTELMDSQWDSAQSTGDYTIQKVHRQLCCLVSGIPLGEILLSVEDSSQCEELYRRYLHDFVRSEFSCAHKTERLINIEYKLIQDSLHNLITRSEDFTTIDGHVTLVDRIAAVHVVYRECSECIHWFGQLTSHSPGILEGLGQTVEQSAGNDDCMMLHLYAVNKILNKLEPPIQHKRKSEYTEDQSLRVWLSSVRKVSNAIESTLSLPSQHPLVYTAKYQWQKVRALCVFTEYIVLNHMSSIMFARRLSLALGNDSNFLKLSTMERVILVVQNTYSQYKKKPEKKQLGNRLKNFFIEVVSGLVFGQSSPPEDELVIMLLNIVFTEPKEVEEGGEGEGGRRGTRNLTPFKDDAGDKQPIIRSFLLQLLLEHDTEKVKCHLKTYFKRSKQALVGDVTVMKELSLLCALCFENAMTKRLSGVSLEHNMVTVIRSNLLNEATNTLLHSDGLPGSIVSLDILESVARIRCCLHVVAELLLLRVSQQHHIQSLYGHVAHQLLQQTEATCTERKINTIDASGKTNTTGPLVYLLKLLVSQGGFSCLTEIMRDPQLKWIIPKELEQDEARKTLDPFVVYNPDYATVREEMSAAAYGRDYKELEEHASSLQPHECVPLLLSVYEVYTMSRASTNMAKQLLPETIDKMNDIIVNCKALSREMKVMARKLVSNEQGGPLAALQVSATQTTAWQSLGALVVHTVTVLHSRSNLDVLCPLVTLLANPGNMANCYLPTMVEDMLPEARKIFKEQGQFYECPNGHPYFVGECGRPVQQTNCMICGSAIGGRDHNIVANNRLAGITDTTTTGYSLGHPSTRGIVPTPERSLYPAACCIVRAIMHSALLWTSCNDDGATGGLQSLVKSGLQAPQELSEFFWGHLEKDIQLLAKALGKNPEDAAIVVHLVLKNILTTPPSAAVPLRTLGTREDRSEWEKHFSGLYINPLLEKLESEFTSAMTAVLDDNQRDHDPLYYLVYERTPVVKDDLEPHLWSYRPRITLEHLSRYMQQQKRKYPILEEFIKNEAVLQATQYIPDIVRLQKLMFDEFHHRINSKVAEREKMKDFILKQCTEASQAAYKQMVASLHQAWSLVRDKLKGYVRLGGLMVKDQYIKKDLGLDTPMEYFIPTTTGPGACTFSLIHYLTYVHNNFIDWCRSQSGASTWGKDKIQLPHVHKCHLLDYQSQLQSILLSHCHYSLRVGQGREVTYDLPALEKCLLDRFIHGKPTILVDIPHVSYQKDVYTAATFAAVRKKVAPQKDLQHRVQLDILRELGSPNKLRKSLDVVEIVLGFLSSGGGKPKIKLVSYLRVLKMEKRNLSRKAKEHCNLEHILSLWKTVSVGLAQHITDSGQEPFHALKPELLGQLQPSQCIDLDTALPKVDLPALLGTLFEFIETFIRHIDMSSKDWRLWETLVAHLEATDITPSKDLEELPRDITLAQAAATWKYVAEFQHRQKQ